MSRVSLEQLEDVLKKNMPAITVKVYPESETPFTITLEEASLLSVLPLQPFNEPELSNALTRAPRGSIEEECTWQYRNRLESKGIVSYSDGLPSSRSGGFYTVQNPHSVTVLARNAKYEIISRNSDDKS